MKKLTSLLLSAVLLVGMLACGASAKTNTKVRIAGLKGPTTMGLVNLLSMVLFGMAIGVLICFLGGLMAIDIVPREATGAALGIVGMASYVGAGLQDIVSGWLINSGKTELDGVTSYNFDSAIVFWIAASAVSFILALFVAKRSHR